MNSGFPNTPEASRPRSGSNSVQFVDGSTVDLIPGGKIKTNAQNPDQYFDTSQFSYPAHGISGLPGFDPSLRGVPGYGNLIAVGNVGRNILNVPGIATVDATIMKETPLPLLGEAGSIQFRTEFFNLLNRPNFGSPDTGLFDRFGVLAGDAGSISSTRSPSRQLQFALKLAF
jgi:hypothetical protein